MTQFVEDLAAELRARGVPHERADVEAFVKACGHLIDDDPSVGRWAREFEAAAPAPAAATPAPKTEIAKLGTGQNIDLDKLYSELDEARMDKLLGCFDKDS
jgi:hypothetical protein